jgi:integrase
MMRKPFYIKSKKLWYFKDSAGKFIRLHEDEEQAYELWKVLSDQKKLKKARSVSATLIDIFEAFLSEEELELPKAAFNCIKTAGLQMMAKFGDDYLCSSITKGDVARWLAEEKEGRLRKDNTRRKYVWSDARKRDTGSCIKRVFKWALDNGLIESNPLATLKLPTPKPRSQLITKEDHKRMVLDSFGTEKYRSFGLYLIASRCGARPQAIQSVTGKNVFDVSGSLIWVFEDHKNAKKTKKRLTVFLSPCLQTLTRILMASRGDGNLFLNSDGLPWKKDTITQRIRRVRRRLGLPEGTIAYSYRHTFATDALLAGVDISTVAALLGHANSNMVARVYGHLDQHRGHLIAAAAKASATIASQFHLENKGLNYGT